jgi:predicted nucleic acid-binding protein
MTTFVDTNVLVYARDAGQPAKQPVARQWLDHLWATGSGQLSTQVLTEYYVTVTRKLRPGMAADDARADVRDLLAWKPLATTPEIVLAAWRIEDRFGLSHWDALIVAAAQAGGCRHLLTEDLHDGQDLDGMIVLNPFLHGPDEIP